MILDLKMEHHLYTVSICYYMPSNAIIILQSTLQLGCGISLSSEMGPFKSLLMAEQRPDALLKGWSYLSHLHDEPYTLM